MKRIPHKPARVEMRARNLSAIVRLEQAVDGQIRADATVNGDMGGASGLAASRNRAVGTGHGGAVARNVGLANSGAGGVANDEIVVSRMNVHKVGNEPRTRLVLFASKLERSCCNINRRAANHCRQLV